MYRICVHSDTPECVCARHMRDCCLKKGLIWIETHQAQQHGQANGIKSTGEISAESKAKIEKEKMERTSLRTIHSKFFEVLIKRMALFFEFQNLVGGFNGTFFPLGEYIMKNQQRCKKKIHSILCIHTHNEIYIGKTTTTKKNKYGRKTKKSPEISFIYSQ